MTVTDEVVDPTTAPLDVLAAYNRDIDNESGVVTFDAERRREIAALAHRDSLVDILTRRRFDLLPPIGPGAPYTTVQGRESGESTSPVDLADLIASIETMGVLQPILVEEEPNPNDPEHPLRSVVAGERRLRAVRWGHINKSDNPHFQQIPAIVVPGPLTDEDRRSWQLIENLAREDLQPAELAGALLFERCAMLVTKLLSHGINVPRSMLALEDPVERFEQLEALRKNNPAAAAPWKDVIHRLGLQMAPRKARQLVAAFRSLPPHVREDMDAEHVALNTRIRFIELRRGREAAADEIWAAVKALPSPNAARTVLPGAVQAALDNPDLSATEAIERAGDALTASSLARRVALAVEPDLYLNTPATDEPWDSDGTEEEWADADHTITTAPDESGPPAADSDLVNTAITALRDLVAHLNDGYAPAKYETGSLRIQARRLLEALPAG